MMMWIAFLFFATFMAAESLFNKMKLKRRYSSSKLFLMDTVLVLLFISGLFTTCIAILWSI